MFWGLMKTSDMLTVKCEDWLCVCCGTDVSSLGQTMLCLVPLESVSSAISIDTQAIKGGVNGSCVWLRDFCTLLMILVW